MNFTKKKMGKKLVLIDPDLDSPVLAGCHGGEWVVSSQGKLWRVGGTGKRALGQGVTARWGAKLVIVVLFL